MLIVKNKRAYFDYTILDVYTAGVKLQGNEVKSIRLGKVSIAEAFCRIRDGEMFITGMHVAEYMGSGKYTHYEPTRERKLLLQKAEILKLNKSIEQKGLTIVPLAIIITKTGYVKLEVGLARGKNTVDKRESIKQKEIKREMKNM